MWICALLTPLVVWLGRRFPFTRREWLRRTVLHLLLSVAFSLIELIIASAIFPRLGVFPVYMKTFVGTFFFLFVLGFHQNITSYWTVLGIDYAIRYYRGYQERERQALKLELRASELHGQLVRSQLGALKMQLQPHFLFNTLNAIMVLVRQQRGRQAEEMLARLSDLLRCVLEDVEAQEVPLRRELEYLQLYLSIEQVRFRDRLRVEISADPATLDAAVPHMVLQPLVENAIRHGIGRSSAAGRLQISVTRVNGSLELKVQDDGPGLSPPDLSRKGGIGLDNTRARLQQLYGDAAHLEIENAERGGAVAIVILPYHDVPGTPEMEAVEMHAVHNTNR